MAKTIPFNQAEKRQHDRSGTIPAMGKSYCYITCPFCNTRCKAFIWSLAGGGKRCPGCKAMHTNAGITVNDRRAKAVPTPTHEAVETILKKDNPSEEDLDTLALAAADFGHESTCPRKIVSAAECLCIRSRILETLNEHQRGT